MKKTAIALTIGSLLIGTSAMAQTAPSPYVNFGLNQRHTSNTDNVSLLGRFGADFNQYFGAEAEGTIGLTEDTIGGVKLKDRGSLGAYVVGHSPINENLTLLGRVGYQQVWAQAKTGTTKIESDDGSFAVGVGGQYMLDDKNGIRADYTRYTENDGTDNFAVSYVRKF